MLVSTRYRCDACGEPVETVVDTEAGSTQEVVEDCPVCCRPMLLEIRVRGDQATVRARCE